MHTISHRAVTIALACFATVPLGAQYTSITTPESVLSADSLKIEWPKTVWFGKHKIKISSYASGVLKTGISSTSNKVQVGDREELMTKEPYKVELLDSLKRKFVADGQWLRSSGTWVPSNTFLNDLLNTGIEEETYTADPSDLEILSAEIHQEGTPDPIWQLKVKRVQSTGIILDELDAFLSNGERIILIEGPAVIEGEEIVNSGKETSYYAFVENGIVLARVDRSISKIAFARETPAITRSLLLTAAIHL
jgi:hypothetical protein